MSDVDELALQREKLAIREKQLALIEGLPFLHGWKWYVWAREFFDSRNRLNFLCAANQISKSSTQIRKAINWATNTQLWPELWRQKPVQFWYLYPSQKQVDAEFKTKWIQFLPKHEYKDHPQYGWKELTKNKETIGILFNTDVYIFFKTYKQNVQTLQTGSCDAIFCDEELPVDRYEELMVRITATDGYFHMVFTATLGQEFWREVIEERGDKEKLVGAFKQQVSMYECMEYDDGTPSFWTNELIERVKARCKSHNEVLRRVYGRFVVDEGRVYEQFDMKRHLIPARPIPDDWLVFGGVDSGSGGNNHPAAIALIAVRPDFRHGEVYCGWRGDKIVTTASDIAQKFVELRGAKDCVAQYYDSADRDFFEISTGMGEPFQPAEKKHDVGEETLNVLFKNGMLFVHDTEELRKLAWEFSSLRIGANVKHAKNDFADATRYGTVKIPWDWSAITGTSSQWVEPKEEKPKSATEEMCDARRNWSKNLENLEDVEEEINAWNELYE